MTSRTIRTTLLDLVQTVQRYAANDEEVVATIAYLVNSGRVQLGGTFAGQKINLRARKPRGWVVKALDEMGRCPKPAA